MCQSITGNRQRKTFEGTNKGGKGNSWPAVLNELRGRRQHVHMWEFRRKIMWSKLKESEEGLK